MKLRDMSRWSGSSPRYCPSRVSRVPGTLESKSMLSCVPLNIVAQPVSAQAKKANRLDSIIAKSPSPRAILAKGDGEGKSADLLPDHVLVVAPIDHRLDVAVGAQAEEAAALH